jgi:hypothetical protein
MRAALVLPDMIGSWRVMGVAQGGPQVVPRRAAATDSAPPPVKGGAAAVASERVRVANYTRFALR